MHLLFQNPILSTWTAHAISFGIGLTYVGSIYLSKNARLSFASKLKLAPGEATGNFPRSKLKEERWRDDPDVIKARMAAVSLATILICLWVLGILWRRVGGTLDVLEIATDATLLRLGFYPLSLSINPYQLLDLRSYSPHFVTPVLFIGPLLGSFLGGQLPGQRNWYWQSHIIARFFGLQGARNYWVGPITEEIVFRACVLSIYQLSGASKKKMIFLAPLTFGLAHAHHAWETYNRYGRTTAAAKRAILVTLFQLTYTTLFGIHVSYLFLRTGSIWPAITSHIFCNTMGIPEIGYELATYKRWKQVIIVTYLAGIAAFIYVLPRWTLTSDNLYWPSEPNTQHPFGKY
ncbi:hypothetical protein CPB83DRAFT_861789 [Crepidotus variabilis]|uniref:intramembrane prenyl-peptidase Rce1 n=1 Tax=Crepidotus variabilis TaxID=179855 RepID=A0A9P6E7X7_9AGAR|nr:hypothetical protein CPB83DRAFT_861789 [Crepidotus variabilis]